MAQFDRIDALTMFGTILIACLVALTMHFTYHLNFIGALIGNMCIAAVPIIIVPGIWQIIKRKR